MIQLPKVIFGTSGLGNLYEAVSYETKLAIIKAYVSNIDGIAVFDTAGKYGAGLALEVLGKALQELNIQHDKVIISNKLGWYQVPLTTPEPTFEKGIWRNLTHDAVQKISYDGIMECYHQGNQLLGKYPSQMASVHDPDEYLAAAINKNDDEKRYNDILQAYKALFELKEQGKVLSVGVGAKNWKSIQRITNDIHLDWVMVANSLTLHSHPTELLHFIQQLHRKGTVVINSAVFNGGFLIGQDYYNYEFVDSNTQKGIELYNWRKRFFDVCDEFKVKPAEACVNFGLNLPGVSSIALSTIHPSKVAINLAMASKQMPQEFWNALYKNQLVRIPFPQ